MDRRILAAAAVATLAAVGGVALISAFRAGDPVIAGVTVRYADGGYSYVETSGVSLADGGMKLPDLGGEVLADFQTRGCDAGESAFCDAKTSRVAAFPCRFPVDATCLRLYPGQAIPRFAGFNTLPAAEASGNCRPVPCTILSGDPPHGR